MSNPFITTEQVDKEMELIAQYTERAFTELSQQWWYTKDI